LTGPAGAISIGSKKLEGGNNNQPTFFPSSINEVGRGYYRRRRRRMRLGRRQAKNAATININIPPSSKEVGRYFIIGQA
jgi:hypothetical protein